MKTTHMQHTTVIKPLVLVQTKKLRFVCSDCGQGSCVEEHSHGGRLVGAGGEAKAEKLRCKCKKKLVWYLLETKQSPHPIVERGDGSFAFDVTEPQE